MIPAQAIGLGFENPTISKGFRPDLCSSASHNRYPVPSFISSSGVTLGMVHHVYRGSFRGRTGVFSGTDGTYPNVNGERQALDTG